VESQSQRHVEGMKKVARFWEMGVRAGPWTVIDRTNCGRTGVFPVRGKQMCSPGSIVTMQKQNEFPSLQGGFGVAGWGVNTRS